MPEMSVVAHDMPEQGPLADHYHRFGATADAITHPHPETTTEQDDLHGEPTIQTVSSMGIGKTKQPPQDLT